MSAHSRFGSRACTFLLALVMLGGCKKESTSDSCTLTDPSSCGSGLVCEAVQGGDPTCFEPVVIRGNVFDLETSADIGGALVVAIDANGAAVSGTATTAADGSYELRVPTTRDADGNVLAFDVTLRVSADDYLPFPKAPRFALPLSLADATLTGGEYLLETPATDVALLPMPTSGTPTGSISGTVSGEGVEGALVVAVQGGVAVATAIVDTDGSYTLFNVPQGSTTLEVYRAGVVVTPIVVDLNVSSLTGQDLAVDAGTALGTVTGSLNFVDASSGAPSTSVILVPASTFDPDTVRGEAPAGLRIEVPKSGGTFTLEGVPPGDYVILAAFENDNMVRDPDETQGGTAVLTVTVVAGQTTSAGSFKITNALTLVGPGGTTAETIGDVLPTFQWYNDPSSDLYELRVYDAYGTVVYERLDVPAGSGNQLVSYALPAGNELEDGMTYQWRLFSVDTNGNTYISASEDLEGVFTVDTTP